MLIIGTGGMGKEVLGTLITYEKCDEICFFDEDQNAAGLLYDKFKVLVSLEEAEKYLRNTDNKFITAIGHPRLREKLTKKIEKLGGKLTSLICSNVFIFPFNDTYEGIFVHPGVGISHGVQIGRSCVLHINSSIGHDTTIGNYVTIGPGASIVGPTIIGDYSYIGANATVLPDIKIGKNVIVAAGAVVNRDLCDYETFIGVRT
ncbi:MAG: NeuD/PglB/VioB family sugar acetyltransferase [Bacteroidota bacterium]